jgi:hypothetical protein
VSTVVTFGEIMMRLATPLGERFEQTKNFEVVYGGRRLMLLSRLRVMEVRAASSRKYRTISSEMRPRETFRFMGWTPVMF